MVGAWGWGTAPSTQGLATRGRGPQGGGLTRQSLSRGPVQPDAHWLWQQSLGDLPRQRPEHCCAQMILVTGKEQRLRVSG